MTREVGGASTITVSARPVLVTTDVFLPAVVEIVEGTLQIEPSSTTTGAVRAATVFLGGADVTMAGGVVV